MPVFAYRGRNSRGELVTGTLDAADQGAVADQLIATGVTPVDIRAGAARAADKGSGALKRLFAPRVGLVDTALFSRQMYTLLKAGVPIMRALGGLQESAINPTLREVIADLRTSLEGQLDILRQRMERRKETREKLAFIDAELVRIEEQVELLREQAVMSTTPAAVSERIDHIAGTLTDTQQWVRDQQQIMGNVDEILNDPPPMVVGPQRVAQ